jgi:hypothetical protein
LWETQEVAQFLKGFKMMISRCKWQSFFVQNSFLLDFDAACLTHSHIV